MGVGGGIVIGGGGGSLPLLQARVPHTQETKPRLCCRPVVSAVPFKGSVGRDGQQSQSCAKLATQSSFRATEQRSKIMKIIAGGDRQQSVTDTHTKAPGFPLKYFF